MNGYLSKPVNRAQLIAAVEKHISDLNYDALPAVKVS
jgi:YesN/AraC family two-component response regulator